MILTRRSFLGAAAGAAVLSAGSGPRPARAALPEQITLDWAYYNPLSVVLKQNGWLEAELAGDAVAVRWVQSAGSNRAIEYLNSGSVEFGSTAGGAALLAQINGSPIRSIWVYSKPEWTALVTRGDSPIQAVGDLRGRRVAVTRGTDPYIFLLRALARHGLAERDLTTVLLQHADGRNALINGDVDAWAGLDPMMAQAEVEQGARLFFRDAEANTYGVLNVRAAFAAEQPDLVVRVLRVYERARQWARANPDDLRRVIGTVAGLSDAVATRQLERTDLTAPLIGDAQRRTLLAAGQALQQSGVIAAEVDVAAAVEALIDPSFGPRIAG